MLEQVDLLDHVLCTECLSLSLSLSLTLSMLREWRININRLQNKT
jgi:hypothetical protein